MIAILGAGQMGEALISGLLRAGVVSPAEIVAAAATGRTSCAILMALTCLLRQRPRNAVKRW